MISFLPKTNAVQDVYAAKTDLMVPVGVIGTNVEPTPEPTYYPFNIVSMVMYNEGGGLYSMRLTSDQDIYGYEMQATFKVGDDVAMTASFNSDANVYILRGYDNDDLAIPVDDLIQGGTWTCTSLTYDGGSEIENNLAGDWTFVDGGQPIQ